VTDVPVAVLTRDVTVEHAGEPYALHLREAQPGDPGHLLNARSDGTGHRLTLERAQKSARMVRDLPYEPLG